MDQINKTVLTARAQNTDGQYKDTSFDLNEYLGNDDGAFKWGSSGFSATSNDIVYDHPYLIAYLEDNGGEEQRAEINLDFFLSNINGRLVPLDLD